MIALWKFLVDTKLIWLVPVIIIGLIVLIWYLKKQAEKKRIEAILAQKEEWGEEMCQWLIRMGFNPSNRHVLGIMQHVDEWKSENCKDLLQRKISLGMTDEMVRLSLGEPTSIDSTEINVRGKKFRWIYGIPRKGAAYIWFKDGVVTKVKQ